ncbi:MAG: hypothetical protein LBC41_11315, partial [Clostridiales bacterium]|nr:hypothetical protein [Clostridiales bacterium]
MARTSRTALAQGFPQRRLRACNVRRACAKPSQPAKEYSIFGRIFQSLEGRLKIMLQRRNKYPTIAMDLVV